MEYTEDWEVEKNYIQIERLQEVMKIYVDIPICLGKLRQRIHPWIIKEAK